MIAKLARGELQQCRCESIRCFALATPGSVSVEGLGPFGAQAAVLVFFAAAAGAGVVSANFCARERAHGGKFSAERRRGQIGFGWYSS